MVFEYLDKAWTVWTGNDIIQAGVTIVVVIIAYAMFRAIILAGTKGQPPSV